MTSTKLLVVDDHPLFANGFAQMVRALQPSWVVETARCAGEALPIFESCRPDLVVVDAGLPDEDGISVVRRIHTLSPDTPQIVISGRNDPALRVRARGAGARGFVAKTVEPEAISIAMVTVLAGGTAFETSAPDTAPQLTARQAEVLELLVQGHGNKEIRHRLGIAERTVRAHLTELFHLLGVGSRMQAVIRAREIGLVE